MTRATLATNIRKYRKAVKPNLSQEAMAVAAGVSHMTISRIERGKQRPGIDILQRIARALGVTLNDLAGKE